MCALRLADADSTYRGAGAPYPPVEARRFFWLSDPQDDFVVFRPSPFFAWRRAYRSIVEGWIYRAMCVVGSSERAGGQKANNA